jgi:hypothetical protein
MSASSFGGGNKERVVMRHMAWQALERQRKEGQQGQQEPQNSSASELLSSSEEYSTMY